MSEKHKHIREIRINPVIPSESVLVATERGMRPRKAEKPVERDRSEHQPQCPFCTGNEDKTPSTIHAWPDEKDWRIRIVENLYPVLGDDSTLSGINFGLQQVIEGYGRHEVIIDHPDHGIALHEMEVSHLKALFRTYQYRMKQLYDNDRRIRYVLVFKNFGEAAGASIKHTHSQIIAMPIIPENVHNEVVNSRDYFIKRHGCIFCTLIDEALTFEAVIYNRESGQIHRKINVGQYVVERGEKFIAIKPFASRYEWEIHILPLEHQSDFLSTPEDDLQDLATVLKNTMARLDRVIGGVQYNYFLHSLPHDTSCADCDSSYHWHLEICPRTNIPTGFELGSGLFVSTISPEDAARQLREVELDSD